MKLFRCKVMGEVDSTKCYSCFSNGLSGESFVTRVLCKKDNIAEEISLDADSEPTLSLSEAIAA